MVQSKRQQEVSIKGQTVNSLGFVVFVASPSLFLLFVCLVGFYNPLKTVKNILSFRVIQIDPGLDLVTDCGLLTPGLESR